MAGSERVRLRRLGPDDWRDWRALRLRALAESPEAFGSTLAEWSGPGDLEERWRARLALPGARNLLARLEGPGGEGDVGMASGLREGDRVGLVSMWVAPEARGRGVGDALVAAVVDGAREDGASVVRLDVAEGNDPALALYLRHGFVLTGELGDLMADGVRRERVMERVLRG